MSFVPLVSLVLALLFQTCAQDLTEFDVSEGTCVKDRPVWWTFFFFCVPQKDRASVV